MGQEWYYTKNGAKHGPVTAGELKALAQAGTLSPGDTVWREGMTGWKPAGKVQGLFAASGGAKGPPPVPAPTPAAEPAPPAAGPKRGLFDKLKDAAQQVQTTLQDPKATQGLLDKATAATRKAGERAEATAARVKARLENPPPEGADGSAPPHVSAGEGPPQAVATPRLTKKMLVVGGVGCAALAVVACVALVWLGSAVLGSGDHPGASGYAGLGDLAKDFDAVYLIQPRDLLTEHRGGAKPGEPSHLFFRGGYSGIRRIAVATRGASTATMYLEEGDGRLVKLTRDTLFDTKTSAYRDAGIDYKLKDGIVSGSWRYQYAMFGGDPTTATDRFAIPLNDQNRANPAK